MKKHVNFILFQIVLFVILIIVNVYFWTGIAKLFTEPNDILNILGFILSLIIFVADVKYIYYTITLFINHFSPKEGDSK